MNKITAKTNTVIEIKFQSQKIYQNSFMDVILDVEFTYPDGTKMIVPSFWAGGNEWRVRFASAHTGNYTYRTICNKGENTDLSGVEGTVEVASYTGDNPLYKYGPVGIAADNRHFEHQDGTPFLWLADTWWKALSKRLTWDGFQELCIDRYTKGFNAVQIVCGPYPDEDAFDPGWANEGGMPYHNREYTKINPEYFNYADRRIDLLVETGLMPVLVGAWGRSDCDSMKVAGVPGLKRHWRYLIARYAAYPLVWIPGGEIPGEAEYGEGAWGEVITYLKNLDPYKRLIASHAQRVIQSKAKLLTDFNMIGGSHFDPTGVATLKNFTDRYQINPVMPILCGETGYEGHMQRAFEDVQRYVFWMYLLNGAAGHTYGAAGLHHMGVEGDPGLKPIWDYTTWQQAKEFQGAVQVGCGRRLLEEYPWYRFEPHPEWSDRDCFAAGIPGEMRMVYRSNRSVYDWSGPRLKELEVGATYKAFYFDPATGRRFELPYIKRIPDLPEPELSHGSEILANEALDNQAAIFSKDNDVWQTHGTPGQSFVPSAGVATEKGKICATNMVSVLKSVCEKDVLVSVRVTRTAESGIVLRFQDIHNYLVGLYNPIIGAIYFLERRGGSWGPFFAYRIPHLGIVDVPEIKPEFVLSAAVCGNCATVSIDDGKTRYFSPAVKIEGLKTGNVGLWRTDEKEIQLYKSVRVSKYNHTPELIRTEEGVHHIHTGEDIAPPVPSPQDWILVMERSEV